MRQDPADVAGRESHRVLFHDPFFQGFCRAGAFVVLVIHGHLIDMLLKALLGIVPWMQSTSCEEVVQRARLVTRDDSVVRC